MLLELSVVSWCSHRPQSYGRVTDIHDWLRRADVCSLKVRHAGVSVRGNQAGKLHLIDILDRVYPSTILQCCSSHPPFPSPSDHPVRPALHNGREVVCCSNVSFFSHTVLLSMWKFKIMISGEQDALLPHEEKEGRHLRELKLCIMIAECFPSMSFHFLRTRVPAEVSTSMAKK